MRTLKQMDKVRFGRALGYGARHAARAMAQAVDAATSPSSSAGTKPASAPAAVPARPVSAPDRMQQATATVRQVSKAAGGIGRSVGAPVVRFSRVLFLQVTGTFFTLIALVIGQFVWRHHADLRLGMQNPEAQKGYLLAAVFVLFAYFALSSFLRARRLERQ